MGLADQDFSDLTNGLASAVPVSTFGVDQAVVEVSEDGTVWVAAGTQPAD